MYPSIDTGLVGGSQKVGFRAHLERWNGSAWSLAASSPLMTRYAGWTPFDGDLWTEVSTGAQTIGTTRFSMVNRAGYFRISYALYWYSTTGSVIGALIAPAWGHRDDRSLSWSYVDWCKY
jgi:hypothetical protein